MVCDKIGNSTALALDEHFPLPPHDYQRWIQNSHAQEGFFSLGTSHMHFNEQKRGCSFEPKDPPSDSLLAKYKPHPFLEEKHKYMDDKVHTQVLRLHLFS